MARRDDRERMPYLWAEAEVPDGFLTALVEHLAHPLFIKDREHRWILLNRAFCELVGHPREAMLGKTDHDFFPKAESDWFHEKDREMFRSGRSVVIDEEPITDAAGRVHVISTTKVPLRAENGKVTHLVGIIHDITSLKEAQKALREANDRLERRVEERSNELRRAQDELIRKERLAVLGRLSGGLAHQLRNPLAAITNAVSVLLHVLPKEAGETAMQMLQIINDEAWEANRTITDLLDYARTRPPERQTTRVVDLVERVLREVHLPAGVEVVQELDGSLEAELDARQVRGALRNLVRNALDAMPGGGRLALQARSAGDLLELVVDDSGEGISPERRASLFEPLVTTKPLGLGLGLTTARVLVENQGGTISFEDREGPGSRFVVRLPFAPGRPQ